MRKIFTVFILVFILCSCNVYHTKVSVSDEMAENITDVASENEKGYISDEKNEDFLTYYLPRNELSDDEKISDYSKAFLKKSFNKPVYIGNAPIVDITCEYPVFNEKYEIFKENSENVIIINESIRRKMDENVQYVYDKLSNELTEEDIPMSNDIGFYEDFSFEVTYIDEELISVMVWEENFFGGFHPNTWVDCFVYSLKTGEEMKADDLLLDPIENVKKAMRYENDLYGGELLFGNSIEELKFEDLDFYVDGENVVFIFSPYEIACYAAGFQKFTFVRSK